MLTDFLDGYSLAAWLLLFLVSSVPIVRMRKVCRDLFFPLYPFTLYFFLGMGVRGILLQSGLTENRFQAPLNDSTVVASAYLYSALGLLALYLGCNMSAARRMGQGARRWTEDLLRSAEHPTLLNAFEFCCAFVGMLGFYIFYRRFSYALNLGHPAQGAALSREGGIFFLTMLSKFPLVGALMVAGRRITFGQLCLLAINLGPLALWVAVIGSKTLIVELAVGLLIVYQYKRRVLIRPRMLVPIGLFYVGLVAAAFAFHNYGVNAVGKVEASQESNGALLIMPLIDREYQFDMFTLVLSRIHNVSDLQPGQSLEELGYFYIPRSWWPDKPLSFGYTFASQYLNNPTADRKASFAPSLPAELYINLHVLGIVIGFLLIGVLMPIIYLAFAGRGVVANTIYTVLLFSLIQFVEGPIAAHIEMTIAAVLPFVLYVGLARIGRAFVRRPTANIVPRTPQLRTTANPEGYGG